MTFAVDERKTILGDYSTLEMLDMSIGENTSAKWLNILVNDLNKFSGSKNMDEKQAESLAYLIAQEYKDIKFSIIQLFFYKFKCGHFGKFWGKVDPMVITCALKDFVVECEATRQEYLNEKYFDHKKEEDERRELQHRAESQWCRCQKHLIENCPDDDGKELFTKISFLCYIGEKRTLFLSLSASDYQMIESRYLSYFKEAIINAFPNIRVQCTINNKEV